MAIFDKLDYFHMIIILHALSSLNYKFLEFQFHQNFSKVLISFKFFRVKLRHGWFQIGQWFQNEINDLTGYSNIQLLKS